MNMANSTVPQIEEWTGECAGIWRVNAPNGLWLRPNPGGAPPITLLSNGVAVYVWCALGAWYCVQTTDDDFRTGWSHSDWLEPFVERAVHDEIAPERRAAARICVSKLRKP